MPKETPTPELISLREAADYAGVCVATIRRRISAGDLQAVRFGPRLIRVDRTELEALLHHVPAAAA